MKNFISTFILLLSCIFLLSCEDDDETTTIPAVLTVSAKSFMSTISENPINLTSLGFVEANASDGSVLSYSLTSQSVSGALEINPVSGELFVADSTAFDFETNQSLTATYEAITGSASASANITIGITDINEGGSSSGKAFITKWETTGSNEGISIPINPNLSNYNYSIDWGDGTIDQGQTNTATHTYVSAGVHTIAIKGNFPGIYLNNKIMSKKIKTIEQWGDIKWLSMERAFSGCENLSYNATDDPDLSLCSSLKFMFEKATVFNGNIVSWDVSSITDMQGVFFEATNFDQPLGLWDMSKVTTINAMFFRASKFNQPLNRWDIGQVTDMRALFSGATVFNQPLDQWNTSNVTALVQTFQGAQAFDQDIDSWDVSSVEFMNEVFSGASTFNQVLNSWNVSKVRFMASMFENASLFNQPLNNWDVSNVTTMKRMFFDASAYSQNLNSWSVANVTDCDEFFLNANFPNQAAIPVFTNCTP